MKTVLLRTRLLAEFIGTYALVFFGTGAVVVDHLSGGALGHLGISITFGLVIGVMVYTYRSVSGAQYNPAVTISLWIRGVFSGREVIFYILIQTVAAIGASLTLYGLVHSVGISDFGATVPTTASSTVTFIVEILTTFTLMTVILGVVRNDKHAGPWAGLAIGGTVALSALAFGPVGGASMNPARSIGPVIVQPEAFRYLWIYMAGPVAGGVAAALVDRTVFSTSP